MLSDASIRTHLEPRSGRHRLSHGDPFAGARTVAVRSRRRHDLNP